VSLYTRTKNDEGNWRYRLIPEGRGIRTGDAKPPFYVRPRYQGRQIWMRLNATTLSAAHGEAEKIAVGFDAKAQRLTVAGLDVSDANRMTIQRAIDKFIKNTRASKQDKTANTYRLHLSQFQESAVSLRFLDQVTGDTIRAFRDSLNADGYDIRTRHNRVITVLSLAKKEWNQNELLDGR
jgi:hypothetical protein